VRDSAGRARGIRFGRAVVVKARSYWESDLVRAGGLNLIYFWCEPVELARERHVPAGNGERSQGVASMAEKRSFPLLVVAVCLAGLGAVLFVYVKGLSAEIDPSSALTPVSGSLHQLAEAGDAAGLKSALKRPGVVIDQPMDGVDKARRGMTPLMLAASCGKAEAAHELIVGGAKVDASTLDGKTPLILAVLSSDLPTVKALLGTQARVDARTGDGWTALMIAAGRGSHEILTAIIAAGANVEFKNKWGQTALMAAAMAGNPENVKALLEARAPVTAVDDDGRDALALATAGEGPVEVLSLLLGAGADVKAGDKDGVTPLMRAADRGDAEKVGVLLQAGAPKDAKDKLGRTAADWANSRDDDRGRDLAKLLK